jgi:hypothetical protein
MTRQVGERQLLAAKAGRQLLDLLLRGVKAQRFDEVEIMTALTYMVGGLLSYRLISEEVVTKGSPEVLVPHAVDLARRYQRDTRKQ